MNMSSPLFISVTIRDEISIYIYMFCFIKYCHSIILRNETQWKIRSIIYTEHGGRHVKIRFSCICQHFLNIRLLFVYFICTKKGKKEKEISKSNIAVLLIRRYGLFLSLSWISLSNLTDFRRTVMHPRWRHPYQAGPSPFWAKRQWRQEYPQNENDRQRSYL